MTFVTLVTAAAEHHELAPLIAPPAVIAAAMAVVLTTAGLITFSYRDVAHRRKSGATGAASSHQDEGH
jgi:hypothetical protein